MTYPDHYLSICREVQNATLVTVSKGHSASDIQSVYEVGCRDFGENRIDEAIPKIEALPKDIRWHFIGTLQSNKVRKAVGRFHLLHSVDSLPLAKKISECSLEKSLITNVLLQVNTSGEASKHGFTAGSLIMCFDQIKQLKGLHVKGLMTMAPLDASGQEIKECFRQLRLLKEELGLEDLSMGMSNDYKIALEEGATLIRIGSAIFR